MSYIKRKPQAVIRKLQWSVTIIYLSCVWITIIVEVNLQTVSLAQVEIMKVRITFNKSIELNPSLFDHFGNI